MNAVRAASLVIAAGAVLAGAPVKASAQGNINARATVLVALTVSGTNLVFGNIATTASKVVAPAAGGTFLIAGAASQPVQVSFGLPANLGAAAVGIGTWTGLSNTLNNAGSATALVPSASAQTRTLSATGQLYVWIGATLTTTAATAGAYTAPVSITVVYN